MEYRVIKTFKEPIEVFESRVNEAIEAGWIPMGGMCVATPNGPAGGVMYFQSMTRKTK